MAKERELQIEEKPKFPRLKGINQIRMREVVRDAELLYEMVITEYGPQVADALRLDCSTASFAYAKYIQQKLQVKTNVRAGIYLGHHPKVEEKLSKEEAVESQKVVNEILMENGEPTKLSKRDMDKFSETERTHLLNQTHTFIIIPRDDGKYFFIDPTYKQFTKKDQECVMDIVDAKKLREKYKILLWSPNAQKQISNQQTLEHDDRELTSFSHIKRAENILKKMSGIEEGTR